MSRDGINMSDYLPESAKQKQKEEEIKDEDVMQNRDAESIRNLIKQKYRDQEVYRNIVDQTVDNIVTGCAGELMELIDMIDSRILFNVERDEQKRIIKSDISSNLTEEELDWLCIKLATLGVYAQNQVDQRSLDADVAEQVRELVVAEKLSKLQKKGQGDGTSRMKMAQRDAEMEAWVSMIKRNAYLKMRHLVERSERLYEAVKKVMDRRKAEYPWNGRS